MLSLYIQIDIDNVLIFRINETSVRYYFVFLLYYTFLMKHLRVHYLWDSFLFILFYRI